LTERDVGIYSKVVEWMLLLNELNADQTDKAFLNEKQTSRKKMVLIEKRVRLIEVHEVRVTSCQDSLDNYDKPVR
jgi:hypothetical protein